MKCTLQGYPPTVDCISNRIPLVVEAQKGSKGILNGTQEIEQEQTQFVGIADLRILPDPVVNVPLMELIVVPETVPENKVVMVLKVEDLQVPIQSFQPYTIKYPAQMISQPLISDNETNVPAVCQYSNNSNIDIDDFDIFDIQEDQISTIEYITSDEIVDECTNQLIFSRKYPHDPMYKKEPIFVPSLQFIDIDTQKESDKPIHFNTRNYEISVNTDEYMRTRNIMKDETKYADPFITWNFFKEDSHLSQFGGLFVDDLCEDAKKIYVEPNAGGNSENSESLSMDILHELYGGSDVRTEMTIEYFDSNWKKCDFLCSIFNQNWGVSVTRAMSFPDPNGFTKEEAKKLLTRKLQGLIVAKQGILINDNFLRSILHIWCETARTAGLIIEAYSELSDENRDNIGVILTIIKNPMIPFVPIQLDDDIKEQIDELSKLSPTELNQLIHSNCHGDSDTSTESSSPSDDEAFSNEIALNNPNSDREKIKRALSIKRYVDKYNSLSTTSRNIFYNYGPKNHVINVSSQFPSQ